MPEPLTLAVLSAVALTEGIKFLYGQAGELLRRRWERKEAQAKGAAIRSLSRSRHRRLGYSRATWAASGRPGGPRWSGWGPCRAAYGAGALCAGPAPVSADDVTCFERADALRQGLEAVYGRRLSFADEDREPSGTRIEGVAEAQTVRGVVAGVSVEDVSGVAEVKGTARVGDVEESGRVFGAEVRRDRS